MVTVRHGCIDALKLCLYVVGAGADSETPINSARAASISAAIDHIARSKPQASAS